MLIYICGKITGTVDYKEKFEFAETDIKSAGHTPINPVKFNERVGETSYEKIMKNCIALLELCEGIYVIDGAEDSCGCNREIGFAIARNMKFFDATNMTRNYEG